MPLPKMSPRQSIGEESTIAASTTTTTTTTITPSDPCCSPKSFPPGAPLRRIYLASRATSTILGLIQIISAAVAFSVFSRRHWLDPCLSPAITSFIYSSLEIFTVLYWHCRAHHLTRALYDGLISVGFAVATGFFIKLAMPSMMGGDGPGVALLGGLILACMLLQIIIHGGISLEGVKDTMIMRHRTRQARNESLLSA
ncbi:hypothetical protein QBC43DRAFT_309915 [Cladorrhinum sp. PSN259]|nr:hypothetical protein QBC43DRAFT_309915 [Cladorrhinum sp. PSN259]